MRFAMLLLLLLGWRLGADDRVAERAGSGGEVGKATKEVPFRNSLGMEFVPVKGAAGLLWSRWETRVQDYAGFCKETGREHGKPFFPQGTDHPVVNVSFEDAVAFCAWLSKKEGGRYRLPTDHEWSVAVGIGDREDAKASSKFKNERIKDVYPWGGGWPPPRNSGNYGGAIKVDAYEKTSPVGKFAPTIDGLYDLGGNVWEWCDTSYSGGDWKVLRGGSCLDFGLPLLLSSNRHYMAPVLRCDYCGFRVVLEVGAAGNREAERAVSGGEPEKATKEVPFRNSLGMEFVPVKGAAGLLWSRWETRVQDYAGFCKETGREHEAPDFPQGEDHPVVMVSFEDAVAFFGWLSKKEGRRYRLPTDHEWSVAVGIGDREDAKASPQSKDEKIEGVYPWGGVWPPPAKSGNYDEAMKVDSFEGTSPVGKFAPTADGLYDLGGNVWEWCDTDFVPGQHWKVLRGASWLRGGNADFLSAARSPFAPAERYVSYGFRVVLEAGGGGGARGGAKGDEHIKEFEMEPN